MARHARTARSSFFRRTSRQTAPAEAAMQQAFAPAPRQRMTVVQ